jgi:hypothetical protein
MGTEVGIGAPLRLVMVWLPAILTLAVIGCYFGFLYQHAINVPFADDIFDVVKVVSDVVAADDHFSAFQVLYAQHNDHRTLASRLVYLGSYAVVGELDFRVLTFLANLALPLLILFFYLVLRTHTAKYLIILPIALILCQLRGYGIMLWSMAAFAYFYVFLYGCYSLYFLHNVSPVRFVLAALLACLATFTLASGQLIWLLGFASLFYQAVVRKASSYGYLLGWSILAFLIWQLWRTGLATPNTPLAMLERVWAEPGYYLLYTLTLMGNVVTEQSVALAAMTGGIMLVIFLTLLLRPADERDLRLALCCGYVLLSIIAMTMGRAPYSTVEYALSSRYSFPSTLLLASLWALLASRYSSRNMGLFAIASLLGFLYFLHTYRQFADPLQHHLEKRVDNFNRGRYWSWPRPVRETNAIVATAISQGIYRPPERPLAQPTVITDQGGKPRSPRT